MTDRERLFAKFGYVSPVVSVTLVFLSTVLDPAFSWRTRSLSSIGEATGTSVLALSSLDQVAFTLFNSGLVLPGLIGAPFAVALWWDATTRTEKAGVVALVITFVALAGVAVAYLDGPVASLHFPTAMTFFVGTAFVLWIHGTGLVKRGETRSGLVAIWIANGYLLFWVVWIIGEALVWRGDDVWTWFAVPEFLAAIALSVWVFLQTRRLLN